MQHETARVRAGSFICRVIIAGMYSTTHLSRRLRITVASIALLGGAVAIDTVSASDTSGQETARDASPQLLMIRSHGKYGLIDRTGKLILAPKYDSPVSYDSSHQIESPNSFHNDRSDALVPASIDHKWGYIDKTGKEVIAPQFSMAGPFREGRAQVQVGENWGLIDRDGKFVIEPEYSFIGPFRSGIARVAVGGIRLEGGFPRSKWGFVNEKGEQIVPPKYDYADSFVNGRALVNIGGKWSGMAGLSFQGGHWGVIDESGKFVVEPKIEIEAPTSLNENENETNGDLIPIKYDGKFGYRDSRWKFVIEPKFEDAQPFSEGLGLVKQGGKFGYIDKSGQWVISPRYLKADAFSDGLAPVVTEAGVRYIDKSGKEILSLDCAEARPFRSGLAEVRVGKLWGIINKRGQYLHKPQFTDVRRIDSEFISVQTDQLHRGLLNREGEVVVEPKYGYIGAFQKNGLAMIDTESMGLPREFWVIDRKGHLVPGPMLPMDGQDRQKKIAFFPKRQGGEWGIVNDAGAFVIAPRFQNVEMLGVGILGVQEAHKWGMVNLENGTLIVEPIYYAIRRFSEGLAETQPNPPSFPYNGERIGYIDLKGQLVIPSKFAQGSPFTGGIAQVGVLYNGDLDWNFIDKEGRYLWDPAKD